MHMGLGEMASAEQKKQVGLASSTNTQDSFAQSRDKELKHAQVTRLLSTFQAQMEVREVHRGLGERSQQVKAGVLQIQANRLIIEGLTSQSCPIIPPPCMAGSTAGLSCVSEFRPQLRAARHTPDLEKKVGRQAAGARRCMAARQGKRLGAAQHCLTI